MIHYRSVFVIQVLGMWTLFTLGDFWLNLNGYTEEWPEFIPPQDSGIINVKDYGAKGDGIHDDTKAIRNAITQHIDRSRYASPPIIWFPAGTYLISGPIEGRNYRDSQGWSSGWRAGFLISGQGRDQTIIRLQDQAPGYQDPQKPKYVIATGSEADGTNPSGGGNRAFRHAVMNLTIDVGNNNPGAIGLDFIANNRGTVENVRIQAPEGSGLIGLAMDRHWPGPCLIKHVEIIGFDISISMRYHWQFSVTFEDITLLHPKKVGIVSDHNPIFMRKFRFIGDTPAIQITADDHLLVLLDSSMESPSRSTVTPAITSPGIVHLQRITCQGFSLIIKGRNQQVLRNDNPSQPTYIASWVQGFKGSLGNAQPQAIDLPIEETPLLWSNNPQDWINGKGNLQDALDSPVPIVYLPNGHYEIDQTLVIRRKNKKLIGFQSSLKPKKDVSPMIRIEGEGSIIFEHLWMVDGSIEHTGTGTVVFRHCDLPHHFYRATNQGKTFFEDVIGGFHISNGHQAWARQLNNEFGDRPLLINQGSNLWILGYKTEANPKTISLFQNQGKSEILGAILYPLQDMPNQTPAWAIEGGEFSGTWVYNYKWYITHVRYQKQNIVGNWGRGPALWSTRPQLLENQQ